MRTPSTTRTTPTTTTSRRWVTWCIGCCFFSTNNADYPYKTKSRKKIEKKTQNQKKFPPSFDTEWAERRGGNFHDLPSFNCHVVLRTKVVCTHYCITGWPCDLYMKGVVVKSNHKTSWINHLASLCYYDDHLTSMSSFYGSISSPNLGNFVPSFTPAVLTDATRHSKRYQTTKCYHCL